MVTGDRRGDKNITCVTLVLQVNWEYGNVSHVLDRIKDTIRDLNNIFRSTVFKRGASHL
jgi:hypothetical protein